MALEGLNVVSKNLLSVAFPHPTHFSQPVFPSGVSDF